MSYLDPETWRAYTREEFNDHLQALKTRNGKSGRRKKSGRAMLVLQESISPLDAYTYLHARFGPPNGLQTMLANDDSDNLFHWDYYLKAGDLDLQFVGATEEVHVWFSGKFSDRKCIKFIAALRHDFGRVAREKGRFFRGLEKWNIFPNQYLAIAGRCADLYDQIGAAVPKVEQLVAANRQATHALLKEKGKKSHAKLMEGVTTAPTELSVLMPVMFESFIGLVVVAFIKPEVKADQAAFDEFVRGSLNGKLVAMFEKCNGFERPLAQDNPAFGRYWTVVNKRNDVIHGNVDPVHDALEVVYFHGKKPLFKTGGDRLRQHWVRLLDRYRPRDVLDDYVAMHAFILEILQHMTPAARDGMENIMSDSQPGWDTKRKIAGRLFPDHVATVAFPDMRYDWQLAGGDH